MTRPCAVAPCGRPRVAGRSYCAHHGPVPPGSSPPTGRTLEVTPGDTCPFCHSSGFLDVRRRRVKASRRPASAKAAVLTGGLSLLLRPSARRYDTVQITCQACGGVWYVAPDR